jgi:hypothetical protein
VSEKSKNAQQLAANRFRWQLTLACNVTFDFGMMTPRSIGSRAYITPNGQNKLTQICNEVRPPQTVVERIDGSGGQKNGKHQHWCGLQSHLYLSIRNVRSCLAATDIFLRRRSHLETTRHIYNCRRATPAVVAAVWIAAANRCIEEYRSIGTRRFPRIRLSCMLAAVSIFLIEKT